ncbi:RHS repeat-associated core domain-containing protein [Flavobacterium lipolyticum]|uniref:RHS repeat-associated core domain-containing protein n=1 Tax=Flavobacterium lipolyticum TaxID=2893754 RepID=UPI003204F7F9
MGNIRLSYTKNPASQVLTIIDENNYYPFGLKHKGYNDYEAASNKYKFNGKELQDELGLNMYDYGARNYDPAIGRWMNMDSKTEAYYPISPYQYVLNNPVVNIDVKGEWTVTRHYNLTYNSLAAAGIGKVQANLLAHYVSVYADNPGSHINANNMAHPTNQKFYSPYIDYSGTSNSQVTDYTGKGYNYNIWHSMRSEWEEDNNTISAHDATERGMEFGWDKIFQSAEEGQLKDLKANSKGIEAFGQGVHALQDAYAHKGRSDVGVGHLWNDRYGDTSGAQRISDSAITVHNIMSGNWKAFEGKEEIKFDANGMTKNQFAKAMEQINKYLNQ